MEIKFTKEQDEESYAFFRIANKDGISPVKTDRFFGLCVKIRPAEEAYQRKENGRSVKNK